MSQKATLLASFPVHLTTKTDKVRKDLHKPIIRDILALTEDRIVLSDFSNGLKCFDSNGTPLSKLRRPSPSTSMTLMSDTRIAFVIPFDSFPETVFVDINLDSGSLTHIKNVHTPTNYRAIASLDQETWVAGTAWWNGAGAIDVLNTKGEVLCSYNHPDQTTTLLKCVVDIVVSPNGSFIASDGNAAKVICFDPKADDNPIKFEFDGEKEGKLKFPCGVAYDSQYRIYVADQTLNHVIVLSSDGTFLQTILDSENGELCNPFGLHILQDRLYVAEKEGSVKIFQLTNV